MGIKVYIIADPSFDGDATAFEIKAQRMAELELLTVPFDARKGDDRAFDHYDALFSDDDAWAAWIRTAGVQTTESRRRKGKGPATS